MSTKVVKQIFLIVKNHKKIIGLLCFLYLWWKKIRPKDHPSIPTLPKSDPLSGHIILALREYENLIQYLYKLWKIQVLPICAFKTWFQFYSIWICEPTLIKYVFETKFEKFKKGRIVQGMFSELLGHGIFMSDPPEWKFHRKVATRMFSMRNLKNYMFECGVRHSKFAITKLNSLNRVDIYDIFSRFTLDAFTAIAFGKSVHSLNEEECDFGNAFDDVIYQMSFRMLEPTFVWKTLRYLNIGNEKKIAKNIEIINKFADTVLDQRQKEIAGITDEIGDKYNDILSLFMKHNKELNRTQLRDIALNMIIAGRDTTRLLCSWFIYEISKHPTIKRKIYADIDSIEIEQGADISYHSVCNKMQYLEACLLESLRVHPVVPWLIRYAVEDVQLPPIMVNGVKKQYTIYKNNQVVIPTYMYGKHPKLWSNPEVFDPMRFYDENGEFKGVTKFDTYVYPFFNIQPRLCIGRQLAITEAKTMLFYFFKNFNFKMEPNQKIQIKPGPVLNMKYGLWIELEKR